MHLDDGSRPTRPLSRSFFYHWLVWFLLSLPFVVSVLINRITRSRAGWLLFNIHDELGYLNFLSGLMTLSQLIFAVILFQRASGARGQDFIAKTILLGLSLIGCIALFLAVTGT